MPRAVVSDGWTRTGELSDTSVASAPNPATTPSDETPRQVYVLITSTRLISRNGLRAPAFVKTIDGSMLIGRPKPPVEPVLSVIARACSASRATRIASASRGVKLRWPVLGLGSTFQNAVA